MRAETLKGLILIDVRTWRDTRRSNTSEFLGFPAWLASGLKRICERQSRWPHLERPPATEDSRRYDVAFETAKAGVAAESVQRRTRRCWPIPGGENSLFSRRTHVNDSRTNGYFHRILHLLVSVRDLHRSSDGDAYLDPPTPRQGHLELEAHPTSSNPTTGPRLAPETRFVDRSEHGWAALHPQIRDTAPKVTARTTTAKTAPWFGQLELGAAKRSYATGYLVSDRLPTQSGSHFGARRDAPREACGPAGRQFRLRSILREDCETLRGSGKFHSGARVQNLPESFANRSSGTQVAAGSGARVASKRQRYILTDR
jgi:hypothetical protein